MVRVSWKARGEVCSLTRRALGVGDSGQRKSKIGDSGLQGKVDKVCPRESRMKEVRIVKLRVE